MIEEEKLAKISDALAAAAKTIEQQELAILLLEHQLSNAISWIQAFQAVEKAKTNGSPSRT